MVTAPTIGRIVHFTSDDAIYNIPGDSPLSVYPAIVTRIDSPEEISLGIFYPTGLHAIIRVKGFEGKAGTEEAKGRWTWPPSLKV